MSVIEVRPGGRRRIDRVLAEDYLREVHRLPIAELRSRRDEAAQEETDLSYLRRVLHARIDIVRAEQARRAGTTQRSVLEDLTGILADSAVTARARTGWDRWREPTRAGERRRKPEALISDPGLSDVGSLSDEDLAGCEASLGEEEASVSERRRQVQAVVDTLGGEIAARYADGAASVEELLDGQRGQSS